MKKFTEKQLEAIKDALKKLYALPPYHGSSNHVAHDAYYAGSIENKYDLSIVDLGKLVGISEISEKYKEMCEEIADL